MNQHDNVSDQDYDDAALSSRYKTIPQEQPPHSIDKVIIKSARDAVKEDKKKLTSPFSRWLMPLATVASVLVVVGLIRLFPEDQIYQLPTQPKTPDLLEEKPATMPPPPSKQSESESKAEREQIRDESVRSDALLRQETRHRAATNIASDAQPTEEQARKGRTAKAKIDTVSESTEPPTAGAAMEKAPVRSAAPFRTLVTPEQWIEHITRLIEHDQIKQAKDAFDEFVQRYPTDPHIDDLRARLKSR